MTQCADCGKVLYSAYEALYHACPEQAKANRKAWQEQRRKQKEQREDG